MTVATALFLLLGILSHSYVDGLNRICVYDSPKGEVHITIPSHRLCPQTIEVD